MFRDNQSSKSFHLELFNWNDELPKFDHEYTFLVLETIEADSPIGHVVATDRDFFDKIEWVNEISLSALKKLLLICLSFRPPDILSPAQLATRLASTLIAANLERWQTTFSIMSARRKFSSKCKRGTHCKPWMSPLTRPSRRSGLKSLMWTMNSRSWGWWVTRLCKKFLSTNDSCFAAARHFGSHGKHSREGSHARHCGDRSRHDCKPEVHNQLGGFLRQ